MSPGNKNNTNKKKLLIGIPGVSGNKAHVNSATKGRKWIEFNRCAQTTKYVDVKYGIHIAVGIMADYFTILVFLTITI